MSSKLPSSGWLRTHVHQYQSKKIGNICVFFTIAWVRPTKAKRKSKGDEQLALDLQEDFETEAKKKKKKKKRSRTTYLDYNDPKNKVALDISVTEIILSYADEMETDLTIGLLIPLSNFRCHNKK